MARLGFHRPILWLYHADRLPFVGQFDERLVVYDCVDEYSTFPSVKTPRQRARLIDQEAALLRTADVVFATTRSLAARKGEIASNTHFVPNVGDIAHFGRVAGGGLSAPDEIRSLPQPRIGYVGAFARFRIDLDLVDYLARERTHWSFVMIGPVTDEAGDSCLPRRPNLHWLGPRSYEDLPAYLAGLQACFLPYALNPYTANAFPMKFHEFLGTGIPLVATALPALEDYADVVPLARSHEEFLLKLTAALEADTVAARNRRLQVAAANSWEHRIGTMTRLVRERLAATTR